ncbi:TPA: hypothetical protein RQN23_000708 [Aeromonas veronii]|nr:hypothetical protein [Aeromonas veronii]
MNNIDEKNTKLIANAQKTIEHIASAIGEGSQLPDSMQQQISSVIIETQAIIGMIAISSEQGHAGSNEIAFLGEYHEKNLGLLADLIELGVVENAA